MAKTNGKASKKAAPKKATSKKPKYDEITDAYLQETDGAIVLKIASPAGGKSHEYVVAMDEESLDMLQEAVEQCRAKMEAYYNAGNP